MSGRAVPLSGEAVLGITWDAKLVSIRWDLIAWCLVLDMDSPLSEGKDVPMRRAWLVFEGMHEISWALDHARLPNGCWLTSSVEPVAQPDGFTLFRITSLAPIFDAGGSVEKWPQRDLCVRAKSVSAVVSEESAISGMCGLDREVRLGLASDADMLCACGRDKPGESREKES
jgi:hypothetical protein